MTAGVTHWQRPEPRRTQTVQGSESSSESPGPAPGRQCRGLPLPVRDDNLNLKPGRGRGPGHRVTRNQNAKQSTRAGWPPGPTRTLLVRCSSKRQPRPTLAGAAARGPARLGETKKQTQSPDQPKPACLDSVSSTFPGFQSLSLKQGIERATVTGRSSSSSVHVAGTSVVQRVPLGRQARGENSRNATTVKTHINHTA